MTEQYRCNKCGFTVEIQDDATGKICRECGHFVGMLDGAVCDKCRVGKMERLRYTRGGDGSHWDGCDETHWDCRIARLEKELAIRDERIERLEKVLEQIILLDLKPYESEYFYGANKLKMIAYEGLKNEQKL